MLTSNDQDNSRNKVEIKVNKKTGRFQIDTPPKPALLFAGLLDFNFTQLAYSLKLIHEKVIYESELIIEEELRKALRDLNQMIQMLYRVNKIPDII